MCDIRTSLSPIFKLLKCHCGADSQNRDKGCGSRLVTCECARVRRSARWTERVRSCCLQAVGVGGGFAKADQSERKGLGAENGWGWRAWFHATGLIHQSPLKWWLPHQGTKGRGKLGCRGFPAGDLSPQHPPWGEKKVTSSQSAGSEGLHSAGDGLKVMLDMVVLLCVSGWKERAWGMMADTFPALTQPLTVPKILLIQQYAHIRGTSCLLTTEGFTALYFLLTLFARAKASVGYKWHGHGEYLPQQLLSLLHLSGSHMLHGRQ